MYVHGFWMVQTDNREEEEKISFLGNLEVVKICRDTWVLGLLLGFWVLGFWVLSKPIIQPTQLGFGLSLAGMWQNVSFVNKQTRKRAGCRFRRLDYSKGPHMLFAIYPIRRLNLEK